MKAMHPVWVLGLMVVAFGSWSPSANGFVGEDHRRFDIDVLENTRPSNKASAAVLKELQSAPAWRQWQRRFPGWQARWDAQSRTVHRAWGPGLRISRGFPTQETIEQDSRELLARTTGWSGVDPSQLRLVHARQKLNRWYVIFEQVVDDTPVYGGRVDVRVSADGQLMMLGADWIRATSQATIRSLNATATLQAAQNDFAQPAVQAESQRSVLVPLHTSDGTELRLADEIVFRTEEPAGLWHCLVDVQTGRILKRQNQHRYVDVVGNISAQVQPSTPFDANQLVPLPDSRLNIGSGLTEFGNTDANGDFSVPSASADSVNVYVRLAGPFARIYNDELGRVTPRIDAKALPGSPINFIWDDSNSRASERDAYAHTLITHDFIKVLDPTFTGVDYIMPIVVDIGGRECNAWWDGWGINFLLPGQRCVNTAQIADVVYHEYGHGITDWQYRPFAPSGAMHEGFSDYLAATMRNDPKIGNGFYGQGTSLRTVDNNMRVPDDLSGEVHHDGLIIAAALWDLRQLIGAARTDSLFHYARYGLANNFDDYLLDVLVTDDDNGSIYDGTPNFDLIIASFASHGIGDYSVQISHDGLLDTEDTAKPLVIASQILSLFPLDSGSLTLHYRINEGAWVPSPLQDAGGVRQFEVMLPSQASGTTVDYWIEATDTQSNSARWPGPDPTDMHRFVIGTDTTPPTIASTPLEDRPLDSPGGWPVRALVSDNLDRGIAAVDLLWSRGNAGLGNTAAMTPLDAVTWNGAIPTGALLGDTMHYAVVATDSASSPNNAQLPNTGTWTFRVVQGTFRDFEANNANVAPSGEWQWGIPTLGPDAWSGIKLWATGLNGGYGNDALADLELPMVDLGTWQSAALSFQHWYAIESFWDGGRVEVSSDNGASWELLVPDGGYPLPYVDVLNGPGFSGQSEDWQRVDFDLSGYLGAVIHIRLHFQSDSGLTDLGWYIDDLEVVERQILAVPLHLASRDGGDSEVPLQWSPPAGIDPQQVGTPLLGYNVYRGELPDLSDATRVNASAVPNAAYVDATVTNGTTYYYAVSAVFSNGESRPTEIVAALPYRAGYDNAVQELVVEAAAGAGVDTSLTLGNSGTGYLFVNAWVGDPQQSIDEVRIAWDVSAAAPPPPTSVSSSPFPSKGGASPQERPQDATTLVDRETGARLSAARLLGTQAARQRFEDQKWLARRLAAAEATAVADKASQAGSEHRNAIPEFTPVFLDPMDSLGAVDLKELAVAQESGQIFFRVTGHSNWGNILTDFTIIISIDSDANRSTGDASGADHHVLVGAFPMLAVGVPAIISNNSQELLGVPWHIVVPLNADTMEVGFAAATLGDVQQVFLSVAAHTPDISFAFDGMPNPADAASWLTLTDPYLAIEAGAPQALRFALGAGLTPNAYDAKLLFDTNDPSQATSNVAVQFRSGVTPVTLHDFVASQERDGVSLSWRTSLESNVSAYRVFRSRENGSFEALQPDVPLSANHAYRFHDGHVENGRYSYRVGEVTPAGEVTLHGLVHIDVTTATPQRAFLDPNSPNPFNPSTTIAFGVDRDGPVTLDVFDARGRLVRTLVSQPHMKAGYHKLVWDGRDQRGRSVASGIYHARLVVNGRHMAHRMTLLK